MPLFVKFIAFVEDQILELFFLKCPVYLLCRTTSAVSTPITSAPAPKLPSEITGKTVEEVLVYFFSFFAWITW